jgi:hypothetical protein
MSVNNVKGFMLIEAVIAATLFACMASVFVYVVARIPHVRSLLTGMSRVEVVRLKEARRIYRLWWDSAQESSPQETQSMLSIALPDTTSVTTTIATGTRRAFERMMVREYKEKGGAQATTTLFSIDTQALGAIPWCDIHIPEGTSSLRRYVHYDEPMHTITDAAFAGPYVFIMYDDTAATSDDVGIIRMVYHDGFPVSATSIYGASVSNGIVRGVYAAGHLFLAHARIVAPITAVTFTATATPPADIVPQSMHEIWNWTPPKPTATSTLHHPSALLYALGRLYVGFEKQDGPELFAFDSIDTQPRIIWSAEIGAKIQSLAWGEGNALYVAGSDNPEIIVFNALNGATTTALSLVGHQRQESVVLHPLYTYVAVGRTVGGFNDPATPELVLMRATGTLQVQAALDIGKTVHDIAPLDAHHILALTTGTPSALRIYGWSDSSSVLTELSSTPLIDNAQFMRCVGHTVLIGYNHALEWWGP